MKKLAVRLLACLLPTVVTLLTARADSITNNFNVVYDYVANGIIGDTNWDGVYLGFGDVPGGAIGGSGAGASLQANSSLQAGPIGYLSVQTRGSDWAGNGDDGFYLWKLVSGDFDVSVQSSPPWTDQGNNFGGLMIRAWNTNLSGARVSFTSTNSSENYLQLWRDQQFSGSQIRQTTNGADIQYPITDPAGTTDTNTTRYYRITRTGDTFTFYWKTNQSDSWILITNASAGSGYVAASGSISRPDWNGHPVQVGIAQAIFARPGNPAVDYFTDFELSGPNVTTPASLPAAPDSLVTSSPNSNGSLTFSWNTNGGTGSILIIRKIIPGGVLVANPVQGLTYPTDVNFQATNTLIAGATHVVYAGSATNVTVSGLGGSNNLYTAEVLSYDNSGSIVYNTANPTTTSFLGTGLPSSVSVNIFPTNLPVGGAGQVQVIATYTTGDQVDVTKDPSVTLISSDPSTVLINSGILNALQPGTATITATYAGFSGGKDVTVITPRFMDNFSVSQDYLNNGLPGSTWDGLYDRAGDVPGGNNGGDAMLTTAADANITSNNVLTVTAQGTTWEGAPDDGFFLFKNMPGDFQAVVHVDLSSHGAYQFAGLMARAANQNGGPYLGSENNMAWWFFDQFSVPVSLRSTVNGAATEQNLGGTTPVNTMWLLLQRLNGTNFYAFYKLNASDPWTFGASAVNANLPNGVPVQIGLAQSTFTAGPAETVHFDSFMLDGAGLVASPPVTPPLPATNFVMTLNPDISMTLSWNVPGTNADGTAIRSVAVMRAGAPVSAQPYLAFGFGGNPKFGDPTQNMGSGNYVVFRSAFGDTNTHQTVTVSGLSPGVQYYAAIYTFVGLGATRTFNTASQSTALNPAFTNLVDGVLIGIQSALAQNGIPLGGVGIPIVNGIFTGGGLAEITPSVTITSDNTNIVITTNNVLTGIALGSTTAEITYGGYTNTLAVTVRNPGFTDNFGVTHDYLASGVTGSPWDGVYSHPNDVPDKTFVSDPASATLAADANITSNNVLSVVNINAGFEFDQDDGFFLFKYVPADFQASVDLLVFTNNGTQNYNNSGLMARGYTMATNGTLGAPLDQSGNECWIAWERFDEFGIGTRYELTIDNGTTRPTNPDVNGPDRYMLLARVNSTNFYFFQRADVTSPWHSTGIGHLTGLNAVAKFAGQPMQVGLLLAGFNSGTQVNVGFANFMLDIGSPALAISPSASNVIVSWPGSPGAQLQSSPTLNPPNWQPVSGTPVFANGKYNLTLPATNSLFFRLQN
jgi:hypothetical protein